jgi:hypothetical protein
MGANDATRNSIVRQLECVLDIGLLASFATLQPRAAVPFHFFEYVYNVER